MFSKFENFFSKRGGVIKWGGFIKQWKVQTYYLTIQQKYRPTSTNLKIGSSRKFLDIFPILRDFFLQIYNIMKTSFVLRSVGSMTSLMKQISFLFVFFTSPLPRKEIITSAGG